jgi:hypothetical protein
MFIFLYFFIVVLLGVHCGIYKSSYNVSNTSYLSSASPPLSFITSSPHSWNTFNRYHFCIYIHVYTVFALYSPSYNISLTPPPSHWYQLPPTPPQVRPVLPSYSLILWKKKEIWKKWHFCLFNIKIAKQGVSLWHFHVYMYYNPSWFISPIFLHSTLVPFLC